MIRLSRRRRRRPCLVAACHAALAGSIALAGHLPAQSVDREEGPVISRVELRGVRSIPIDQAKLVLRAKATYCRLPLTAPICALTRNAFFVRKHYLGRGELERDVVSLRALYWTRGFREARIDTAVALSRRGVTVTFLVDEGPPTLIDSIAIDNRTPLLDDAAIRRALHLRTGAPLDLASIDTGLLALRDTLWESGFADAILEPEIGVDDATRRARVRVLVDPRWRARVSSVTIEGNSHLSDGALHEALTVRTGKLFRRSDVLASQRHLYQSMGIAGAVIVTPPRGDSLKQVEVRVVERPPRQLGLSGGVTTIDFVQLAARGGLFAIGGGRWQLQLRGAAGNLLARQLSGAGPFADIAREPAGDAASSPFLRPTWQGSLELTRLWAGSPRNRISIGAFAHRRSEPNVFIDRGTGAFAMFTREIAERATVSVGHRIERAEVDAGEVYFCQSFGLCDAATIGALREPNRLASATVNGWVDRSNSAVAPSRGYTLRLDADHASPATGSRFRHDRIDAEATTYAPLGAWVLAARARGGWVGGSERNTGDALGGVIHPRARFYAGGVESVRGFGENQLGPRVLRVRARDLLDHGCTGASLADASCDPGSAPSRAFSPRPVGATSLLEGSIELRRSLRGRVGGVLFVDGALLGARFEDGSRDRAGAITPGIGLRVESTVGTLRLDAGWRPSREERLPVVVETPGPDGRPRVTRLSTEKAWDPLDGAHGLRRRATFHFVLGHAF